MGTSVWLLLLLLLLMLDVPGVCCDDTPPDCDVFVTGPEQPWTPSMDLRTPGATSANLQFTRPPPEHRPVTFSVRSAAIGLRLWLFDELTLGGALLKMDATHWALHETYSGTPGMPMKPMEYSHRAGPLLYADRWTSYSVELDRRGTLRVYRLYDDGSHALVIHLRHPMFTTIDAMRVSTVTSGVRRDYHITREHAADAEEEDAGWSFWTFDSTYHRTAGLCEVRPSLGLPAAVVSPGGGQVTLEAHGTGSLRLRLFGTSRHFYRVMVTPHELTVSRLELGAPERLVARRCRSPLAASMSASVKLLLVGDGGTEQLPGTRERTGLAETEVGMERGDGGSGESEDEEGSAEERDWEMEGSAMGSIHGDKTTSNMPGGLLGPHTHMMATGIPVIPLDVTEPIPHDITEGSEATQEVTESLTDVQTEGFLTLQGSPNPESTDPVTTHGPFRLTQLADSDDHELTALHMFPVPVMPVRNPAPARDMLTSRLSGARKDEPTRTVIISWKDGRTWYEISELITEGEQSTWTDDCPTDTELTTEAVEDIEDSSAGTLSPLTPRKTTYDESAEGDDKLARSAGVGVFHPNSPADAGGKSASGASDSLVVPRQPVLLTAALSAACLLLLITTVVLASLLLGRHRRRRANFSPPKSKSAPKSGLFGATAGGGGPGVELSECRHQESVVERSVVNENHGITTFKPKRRPAVAVTVTAPEVPLEALPPPPDELQQQPGVAVGQLPVAGGLLEPGDVPLLRRESTPPLPPPPSEQRVSTLPPPPDQLLPRSESDNTLPPPPPPPEELQPPPPPPGEQPPAEESGLTPPPGEVYIIYA